MCHSLTIYFSPFLLLFDLGRKRCLLSYSTFDVESNNATFM
jgi:hypothetical protein